MIDRQAPTRECGHHLGVTARLPAARGFADAVAEHRQGTLRRHGGIQLPEAARRAVARVDDGPLPGLQRAPVEGVEAGDRHVHLAANLQRGRHIGGQPQRNFRDGPYVGGNLLAGLTVATGGSPHQGTVGVQKADGDPVDLRLAEIAQFVIRFEESPAALLPSGELRLARALVQGQHRRFVVHLGKLGRRCRANPLGWRVGDDEFRVRRFEIRQSIEQGVVLGVGYLRIVENEITVPVVVELFAECGYLGSWFRPIHGPAIIRLPSHALKSSRL